MAYYSDLILFTIKVLIKLLISFKLLFSFVLLKIHHAYLTDGCWVFYFVLSVFWPRVDMFILFLLLLNTCSGSSLSGLDIFKKECGIHIILFCCCLPLIL